MGIKNHFEASLLQSVEDIAAPNSSVEE